MAQQNEYICPFGDLTNQDTKLVGSKNANLGEMIQKLKEKDIRVPDGFATTARAYRNFIAENQLEEKIRSLLNDLKNDRKTLREVGKIIRRLFKNADLPEDLAAAIRDAYKDLCQKYKTDELDVAVRSSATAEDLPEASFAGQQETFLNITGTDELIDACKKCYVSLFTDRAITHRNEQGLDHMKVALSIGVQKMVRSDKSCSGVMFSIDTETGFPDVVAIDAAWGLGENVVRGSVNPDEYIVFKPLLNKPDLAPIINKTLGQKEKKMIYATGDSKTTKNVDTCNQERNCFVLEDSDILTLARWAKAIEDHYNRPMNIEWAKDGRTGQLFIVQARPETVQSQKHPSTLQSYKLKKRGNILCRGLAIGQAIAAGKARRIDHPDQGEDFQPGDILVTGMTDPDWLPIIKRAAALVTDHGGRTSHAAIVSRELGIPAVVGTEDVTARLDDGKKVTVSCAEGDQGFVCQGILEFDQSEIDLEKVPEVKTQIMMNIANPAAAFRWFQLPCRGIGLVRMEFIINNIIKIHPLALIHFDRIEDRETRKQIERLTAGYRNKTDYFVDHLARGLAHIAASQWPDPAIVRFSDFKTNEYVNLIGGKQFEPDEENPMLGFRGASRYYSAEYRPGFELECRAIKKAREQIGLSNIKVMIPFCRTVQEADHCLEVMADNGLKRGHNDLQIYLMAQIPSNIIQAADFSKRFDGFSIGSNDLTQLVLGVDRDSECLSHLFDEHNPSVKSMISRLIKTAHEYNRKVGFCGQVPSDSPEFAAFLVKENIDSISLNPDSVIKVIERIAEIERGPIPTLRIQTVPIKEKFSKFWRRAVKHQYAQ